jgi:hypothetical protein
LRAVLLAGAEGLREAELEGRCEGLGAGEIAAAVEDLRASGLLKRKNDRLLPSGPATHFHHLRPL